MIDKIKRRLRWAKLKLSGAKVDYGIQSFDNFFTGSAAGLECGNLYIYQGSKIIVASHRGVLSRLKIGSEVYINHYSIIDCHHLIKIGDRVNIGPYCYIGNFDHDISLNWDNASVQPEGVALPVVIENNVWLGAGVVVLKGVTIGESAIVGALEVLSPKMFLPTLFSQAIQQG
jgi:acetyltransferase-like isoleucine patch superfamily enzyme